MSSDWKVASAGTRWCFNRAGGEDVAAKPTVRQEKKVGRIDLCPLWKRFEIQKMLRPVTVLAQHFTPSLRYRRSA